MKKWDPYTTFKRVCQRLKELFVCGYFLFPPHFLLTGIKERKKKGIFREEGLMVAGENLCVFVGVVVVVVVVGLIERKILTWPLYS